MRFFFRLRSGEVYDDAEGTELANVRSAERAASKIAAEWLRDNPDSFLADGSLGVDILDEQGRRLATINLTVERAN